MAFQLAVTNCPAPVRAGACCAVACRLARVWDACPCHPAASSGAPPRPALPPTRRRSRRRRPLLPACPQELARTNRLYVAQDDPVAALGYIQLGGM